MLTISGLSITPHETDQLEDVLDLAFRSWAPVFPLMKAEMPDYLYQAFYPTGWEARQRDDVAAACADEVTDVYVATLGDVLVGFVGLRAHPQSSMGEVYIIAVDPAYQRQGVGKALLDFCFEWMSMRGLKVAMVETGGDKGHEPSRAIYEAAGFARLPVARYFRKL